ncbi:MAG: FAD-binding oxidoreductase, partial [Granulicella sp.]
MAPATTEEVAAVLRYAHANGVAVTPWGGGTKQMWCEPAGPSVRLEMGRMGRVLEHPWQDMTCTVEAGCAWAAMQAELTAHGQFVALDPLFAERATVGGVVAANDSGALRLKYGSLRDLVIGMTVVLADGTIAKTGGKVVKNVAGYDLHKLMTGAFGTLGAITEVTFRLHSVARHTRSFTVSAGRAEALGKLMMQVIDSHLNAQSLQMRADDAGLHLDVRLAALPEVMEEQGRVLGAMAAGLGLAASDADEGVWGVREGMFAGTMEAVVKATMLPSEIAPMTVTVANLGGRSVAQATGVMTAAVPAAAVMELRQRVERERGTVVILRQAEGPELDRWGTLPDTLPLMREVKQMF